MKNGFILRQPDSAPPQFFAPAAYRRVAAPAHQAWSEDPKEALCFASNGDAQTFADTFLPQLATFIAIVPYTEP